MLSCSADFGNDGVRESLVEYEWLASTCTDCRPNRLLLVIAEDPVDKRRIVAVLSADLEGRRTGERFQKLTEMPWGPAVVLEVAGGGEPRFVWYEPGKGVRRK